MRTLGISLKPAFLLALAWICVLPAHASEIRVRNDSKVDFQDVVVGNKKYGDIKPGASTGYQTWATAYRYALVSLLADSKPLRIQPEDYVGETPLGEGRFTFVLTIKGDSLEIVALPDDPQPEFTWVTNRGTIILAKYSGNGGEVIIPGTISGLPVTSIGSNAFWNWKSPELGSVKIPGTVTNIGNSAFKLCTGLGSITIPKSVTEIGDQAFQYCVSLQGIYFEGNAPKLGSGVFDNIAIATVYYQAGSTGWGTNFGGRRTVLWKP